MAKDYYKILGVAKTATKDEIKKAFRELAHKHHPDKSGGDDAKFKEINEAYQVLSSDDKRAKYDQFGSDFANQGGFGGGMNWDDFMRAQGQGGFNGVDFGDLEDILGGMFSGFGGSSRKTSSRRGRTLEVKLDLTFNEAVFGAKKKVHIKKLVACDECSGTGGEKGSGTKQCATCHGSGQVTSVQRTILGNIQTRTNCAACHGEGTIIEKPCKKCRGDGRTMEGADIEIQVPAGVDDGMVLTVSGQGEAGKRGAHAGDLHVRLRVEEDPRFVREGDTIYSTVLIPFSLAALGGEVDVQTVDGAVSLKIPAGTESGKIFSLKGKGVHHVQKHGRGDHLVTVSVAVPKKLTKEQKGGVEQLSGLGL